MSDKTTYTRWAQVPENLKTKTQLDKEHLKPVGDPMDDCLATLELLKEMAGTND